MYITLTASEISTMDHGDNIGAIKSVNKRTKCGLAGAHALVMRRSRYFSMTSMDVVQWYANREARRAAA